MFSRLKAAADKSRANPILMQGKRAGKAMGVSLPQAGSSSFVVKSVISLQRSVFGVQGSMFGVRRSVFNAECSIFRLRSSRQSFFFCPRVKALD
jgi:hypothetical protein